MQCVERVLWLLAWGVAVQREQQPSIGEAGCESVGGVDAQGGFADTGHAVDGVDGDGGGAGVGGLVDRSDERGEFRFAAGEVGDVAGKGQCFRGGEVGGGSGWVGDQFL